MTLIPRDRLLSLLTECTGDEIWSIEHCRMRRIPDDWIEQLADAFESGFETDSQSIYTDSGLTNQYHGVRDVDLAIRIAGAMGIHVDDNAIARHGRARLVQAIKDAVMDGDDEV